MTLYLFISLAAALLSLINFNTYEFGKVSLLEKAEVSALTFFFWPLIVLYILYRVVKDTSFKGASA